MTWIGTYNTYVDISQEHHRRKMHVTLNFRANRRDSKEWGRSTLEQSFRNKTAYSATKKAVTTENNYTPTVRTLQNSSQSA